MNMRYINTQINIPRVYLFYILTSPTYYIIEFLTYSISCAIKFVYQSQKKKFDIENS